MSSIKTTQMDGDVSVGRNVAIGGKAEIQGSMTIEHNVVVKGWLDAKNIKGVNKGVFADIASLKEAYPNGSVAEGSWAIVGGTLPGELWYVKDGVWVDSGNTAGSVTADVTQYDTDIATLKEMAVKMVTLTQDEYDALVAAGTTDADTYYNIMEE